MLPCITKICVSFSNIFPGVYFLFLLCLMGLFIGSVSFYRHLHHMSSLVLDMADYVDVLVSYDRISLIIILYIQE